MNIAQGLKEKNRIVGRIAELEKKIIKNNKYQSNRPPVDDVAILFERLQLEKASLVRLKQQLAVANAGISAELADLAETKGMIKFLETIPTGVCGYPVQTHDYATNRLVDSEYTIEYTFDQKILDNSIECYRALAEKLQDTIDNYNATTTLK
jgi:hypothetical protein